MDKEEVLAILGEGRSFLRPTVLCHKLQHHVEHLVRVEGLKAQNRFELESYLPHRPGGVYFWNAAEMPGDVEVEVASLDTSRLYAFPSMLAMAANHAGVYGAERIEAAVLEVAAEFEPVPYAEYDGSFAAEWIYATDCVSPELLKWRW